ncbi:aldehyde dehydrogenase family protein [Chloroflexota bacterium]
MVINGEWTESADGRFLEVDTPIERGRVIGEVPRAGAEDVDRACEAAALAFEGWRRVPARERGFIMMKIADEIENQVEVLSRIHSLETGKAIRTEVRPETKGGADLFRYFGGVAGELKGETVPYGEDVLTYTRREPLGVVGAIVPWNGPFLLSSVKVASALTAGNTVVLKPSISAPLNVLELGRICNKYLPAGVLNVITGTGGECGDLLARHPLVRHLSFTGSTGGGRSVMMASAERIVPVTMELGGKNPQIVFPDADDEQMAEGVIKAARFTLGGAILFLGNACLSTRVNIRVISGKNGRSGKPV